MYVENKICEMQMVTDINPLDSIVTLISSNYIPQDGISPYIAKIYTYPTHKAPKPNEDYILVYSQVTNHTSVGMGANTRSQVTESLKIDIRSKPSSGRQTTMINDRHARKVLSEVQRIIFANIVNPSSDFDNFDPNIKVDDLSNGNRAIFRYVITLNLVDLCRDMTA